MDIYNFRNKDNEQIKILLELFNIIRKASVQVLLKTKKVKIYGELIFKRNILIAIRIFKIFFSLLSALSIPIPLPNFEPNSQHFGI